jgi:Protein of unknown function (DUF3306)
MSEDFLSRWSRRKREAIEEAKDAKDASPPAAEGEPAPESETPVGDAKPLTTNPAEPAFDITSLPPIESITAATDIRPFLAPGVPAEIARAALRRGWTADPAIRNFVGLADYAWDYHTPGSMAGFGPLEMTDELRQAVARIIGGMPDGDPPAAPALPASDRKLVEKPNDIKTDRTTVPVLPNDSNSGPEQDVAGQRQDVASNPERYLATEATPPAMPQVSEESENTPTIVRRTHGGALPK